MHSLQTSTTSVGAWAAGILLVCLPIRGYVLHGELLLGAELIDPVYGTAYVGAVLTLVTGTLLVRGERDATETVTDRVLDRPARSLAAGVGTLAALGVLGVALFAGIEGLSWLAGGVDFLPLYFLMFLGALVLLAASLTIVVYATATMLFGVVFGYLALGRAAVGAYGWPPVIIAGAVLANAVALFPVASLVLELGLATAAVGGLVLAFRNPRPRARASADPSAP